MPATVLFNLAGGIINSLAGPLTSEIKLLWGAKGELEKLKEKVSIIQAVLLDAEEQKSKNRAVSRWLGKLSDVLYQADDVVDAVSTHALRQEIMSQGKKGKKVRIFFSESNQLAFRVKMAHKIKVIRKRFDEITAEMKQFQFVEHHGETPVRAIGRNETYSFLGEEVIIGRENDKKAIIKSLLETKIEENVSILPIVGIGGLGKTTLAQLIFNDKDFTETFDLKMWVCVSDNFDVKILVKKVLESARNCPLQADTELNTLVNYLRDEIGGKKYFLVLDDLWNEDNKKWFELKNLIMGAQGSAILVTTRSRKVAKIIRSINPYILGGLDGKASWDLFKKMAFKNGEEPKNSTIVEIGKEVVKKCVGVPLAIRAVGRMLSLEDFLEGWLAFKDYKLSNISQSDASGIISTLKLSYDKLPFYLKHCFVYCSLFPKDYEFDKSILINLWIAQGFVESQENRCLEDIGHDYLMELVSRLFFQEVRVDVSHGKTIFKMHDLMHDLAISMARSMFITTIGNKKGNDILKMRHISICGDNKFPSMNKVSRIRTFICFEDVMDFEKIISCLKLLRALVLRNTNVEGLPSYICKLKHLRYLDLSNNKNIKKLSNSITKLVNLQTLVLFGCERLEGMPSDIEKLKYLQYLDLSHNKNIGKFFKFIIKLGNLKTLILSGCEISEELLSYIDELNCLKYLDLSHNCNIQKLPNSLTRLLNLETLVLAGCKKLEELPKDFSKLVNLRHLYNNDCELLCMPFGIGQLTNLQTLTNFKVDLCSHCKHKAGFNELSGLSNLRGRLQIYDCSAGITISALESVDSKVKSVFNILNVMRKVSLRYLSSSNPRENEDFNLLSQPFLLTRLVQLHIFSIGNCQYLPPFNQLPFLEILELYGLKDLEYILGYDDSNDFNSSSMPITCFPSLKTLKILYCGKLKGWLWRRSIVEVDNECENFVTEHHLLRMFSCLSQLCILGSPMLTSMPIFPHVEGDLNLSSANWKLLQQTIVAFPSSPLSKLKSMKLLLCDELQTLPMEWLENLTSLEGLEIKLCSKFKTLGQVQNLTSPHHLSHLSHLSLIGCPELELTNDNDGVKLQGLKSLHFVRFENLPKLLSLPLGLQHVLTVRELYIKDCNNLTTIPDWIYGYKSLKVLEIISCYSLTSLPKGVDKLISLERLTIENCPITLKGLEGGTGHKVRNDDDGAQVKGLRSLFCIRFAKISKLVSLPLWLQHATELKELYIGNCESLTSIPEWICNYKSLKMVEIVMCYSLISLPKGMDKLVSLERLIVENCPITLEGHERGTEHEVRNDDDDGSQVHGLRRLYFIRFRKLPKLVSLPFWIKQATALKELYVSDCESLTKIPEYICNYKSLKNVKVIRCSSLISLPKAVDKLVSLESITIQDCPITLEGHEARIEHKVRNNDDGVQMQGVKTLFYIKFEKLPKLVSLPLWLQHAITLKELSIKDCESLTSIPKWICNYKSLEGVEIVGCSRLISLPKGLDKLISLKRLTIMTCPITFEGLEGGIELEVIKSDDGVQQQGLKTFFYVNFEKLPKLVSLPLWLQHAIALKELSIKDCESLTSIPEWICNYKSLEGVEIVGCSSLISLPKGLDKLISLKRLTIKSCPITFEGPVGGTELEVIKNDDRVQQQGFKALFYIYFEKLPKLVSLPLWLQHATALNELSIKDCESLSSIPEWICNYKSLEGVEIVGCSSLISFPKGLDKLISLNRLTIKSCPITFEGLEGGTELKVINNDDEVQQQGLKTLFYIHFEKLPKLVSLPLWLQHATALKELSIKHCESLTSIPEWIFNYNSLEGVQIVRCSSLISLPKGLDKLISLKRLTIEKCPITFEGLEGGTS